MFAALRVVPLTHLLTGLGADPSLLQSWIRSFPYLQIGELIGAAISACAAAWLSAQLKQAWQIGIIFGAADAMAGSFGSMIAEFLRPYSEHTLLPRVNAIATIENLIWGVVMFSVVGLAMRVRRLRAALVVAASMIAWCISDLLMLGISYDWSWDRMSQNLSWTYLCTWAVNGAIFGLAAYAGLSARQSTLAGPRTPNSSTELLPKSFFLTAFSSLSMIGFLLLIAFETSDMQRDAASNTILAAIFCVLLTATLLLVLIHKMWGAIQDAAAPVTPGRAVGLLFVPIFNYYWLWRVLWRFHDEYNEYIFRHSIPGKPLPRGLFSAGGAALLLTIIAAFAHASFPFTALYLFIQSIAIANICDAVNTLPSQRSDESA
jgi:hypothetical protein